MNGRHGHEDSYATECANAWIKRLQLEERAMNENATAAVLIDKRDEQRSEALRHAVNLGGSTNEATVLQRAKAFDAFLTGGAPGVNRIKDWPAPKLDARELTAVASGRVEELAQSLGRDFGRGVNTQRLHVAMANAEEAVHAVAGIGAQPHLSTSELFGLAERRSQHITARLKDAQLIGDSPKVVRQVIDHVAELGAVVSAIFESLPRPEDEAKAGPMTVTDGGGSRPFDPAQGEQATSPYVKTEGQHRQDAAFQAERQLKNQTVQAEPPPRIHSVCAVAFNGFMTAQVREDEMVETLRKAGFMVTKRCG